MKEEQEQQQREEQQLWSKQAAERQPKEDGEGGEMSCKGRRKKQKAGTMRQHFHYLIFQHSTFMKDQETQTSVKMTNSSQETEDDLVQRVELLESENQFLQ